MNPRIKIGISKVIAISFFWMIGSLFFAFYDHMVLASRFSTGVTDLYSISNSIIAAIIASLIASVLGASFLVFFINEKFRDKSYGYTLLAVSVAFVLIVALITTILGLIISPIQTGKPFSDLVTQKVFFDNYSDPILLKTALTWYIIVLLTEFFLQIDNKFGKGILRKFIFGRYRHPIKETRVFMFLDIDHSTKIAEQLGNEKYHQLLKDFFSDITDPVVYNHGEIYQYVGDEVVVSWLVNSGLHDGQCIKCFFEIKDRIKRNSDKYQKNYGLVPSFKAGFHCGDVIAGEIGVIKRDITYSGDILNTTSRIQGKCHDLDTDILASSVLIKLLPDSSQSNFKKIASIELKGKSEGIELMTVH